MKDGGVQALRWEPNFIGESIEYKIYQLII